MWKFGREVNIPWVLKLLISKEEQLNNPLRIRAMLKSSGREWLVGV